MQKTNFRAFTLVELIVVITIVWILSTIGFVSYSGYLTGARDSNRISQMTKLSDSLQVYSASKTLPLPDNKVDITASWAVIAYQWEVWVDVLETIDYTNGGADPKDGEYYTYYLTKNRNSMQLMAFMEEQGSVAQTDISLGSLLTGEMGLQTYAADYEERYPKVYGRKLWILTQETTNTPIQQLSAYDATAFELKTETGFIAHVSDDEKIEGTSAWDLAAAISNGSCKRIKQTGWASGNGNYTINPGGTWDIKVYCDMETAWGWWTMVARSVVWGTGDFGWNQVMLWDIKDDSLPFSLGTKSHDLVFDSMMLTWYDTGKIINNYHYILSPTLSQNIPTWGNTRFDISSCNTIISFPWGSVPCTSLQRWGLFTTYGNKYYFNNVDGQASGLIANGWNLIFPASTQWMIFVK